jgi:hypothetical protein
MDRAQRGNALRVHPSNVALARDRAAQLLMHELSGDDRLQIAGALRRAAICVETTLVGDTDAERAVDVEAIDVAAIKFTGEPAGLVFAAELAQRAPWVQVVFWASEQAPTAAAAAQVARSLGISRVIPQSRVAAWLTAAITPLTRLARARRAALEAEATIPCVPELPLKNCTSPIALPEAERQFRETYLRRLLSESPSAKKAAERAGVPYTTLCSMMKKLGLSKSLLSA